MKKESQYHNLQTDLEVKEEIEGILTSKDNNDWNNISVYSVLKTIENANNELQQVADSYNDFFRMLLKKEYTNPAIRIINISEKEFVLAFTPNCRYITSKLIVFSKNQVGLYLKKDENGYGKEVLDILRNYLIECYTTLLKYSEFYYQSKEGIKTINSNLFVFIDKFGIQLSNYDKYTFLDHFSFSAFSGFGTHNKGTYECNYELSKSYDLIKGNEEDLLRKIFIQIADCPKWCQMALYQEREKQLKEKVSSSSIKSKILKLKRNLL